MVSGTEAGGPTAYLVSKTRGKLFARSLAESTGRDPETPRAAPDSTLAYRPSVTYVGTLRETQGLRITAADSNGADVSLLPPTPLDIRARSSVGSWEVVGPAPPWPAPVLPNV